MGDFKVANYMESDFVNLKNSNWQIKQGAS